MFCDLHTHSIFSDGTDTPEELIARAEALGLGALALTDHNSVDGLPRFLAAAEGSPVQAVPGIEFSTGWDGGELHILALFVRPESYDQVRAIAAEPDRLKRESNLELTEALRRGGYPLDYEAMEAAHPTGRINRAQFAEALAAAGYTRSGDEAFATLLHEDGPFYKPPKRLPALEVVRFIRSIGAVAVLAHPFIRKWTTERIEDFLTHAVPEGLDGMETLYSEFDKEKTREACRLADQFGLLHSGGSDYHGWRKPGIAMGTGKGNLAAPMEFYRRLQALAQQRQG